MVNIDVDWDLVPILGDIRNQNDFRGDVYKLDGFKSRSQRRAPPRNHS
jgi:hypothetical protein